MCELMALSFAKPVSADFSIRAFALRGQENADGWGLAWYPDRSLAIVKEPVEWRTSKHSHFLESYPNLLAPIYIAHVRHMTPGSSATHANTHPFAREWRGQEYCLAHNGNLTGPFWDLPLGRFRPVGGTDSEFLFCYLMEQVAQRADALASADSWRWLHEQLTALNRMGQLNCLLSDGRRLFCYHDANGYKGLTARRVLLGSREVSRFEAPEVEFQLEGESINHGFVVATCALSPGGWHPFEPGELQVLEAGALRFSSHPRGGTGAANRIV